MNAKWTDYCLVTPDHRTLACVRQDEDGSWVWHARNSYSRMDNDIWFGLPRMTEEKAMRAAEDKLYEEYTLLKGVFE